MEMGLEAMSRLSEGLGRSQKRASGWGLWARGRACGQGWSLRSQGETRKQKGQKVQGPDARQRSGSGKLGKGLQMGWGDGDGAPGVGVGTEVKRQDRGASRPAGETPQKSPQSLRFSLMMMSVTASKTNLTFCVSVAHVMWE